MVIICATENLSVRRQRSVEKLFPQRRQARRRHRLTHARDFSSGTRNSIFAATSGNACAKFPRPVDYDVAAPAGGDAAQNERLPEFIKFRVLRQRAAKINADGLVNFRRAPSPRAIRLCTSLSRSGKPIFPGSLIFAAGSSLLTACCEKYITPVPDFPTIRPRRRAADNPPAQRPAHSASRECGPAGSMKPAAWLEPIAMPSIPWLPSERAPASAVTSPSFITTTGTFHSR